MKEKSKKILLITMILMIMLGLESQHTQSLSTENLFDRQTEPTFTLYNQDGETYEPIEGSKFIITDLEGNPVIGDDGQIVGTLETINGNDYYVLTTDKAGYIKANLPKGFYKATQIEVKEAYTLEKDEQNRTYYFEIGLADFPIPEWINGIRGYAWNNVQSVICNTQGGVILAGSISEYLPEITGDFYDGVDLNGDGITDETARGNKDGIIISYDEYGNYLWSETIGGNDEDSCSEILQTADGGYIVVGYVASNTIYFNGKIIPELSKTNENLKNKDGYLLKINPQGEYEWGIRMGGTLDDEITKVLESTNGDFLIAGNFCSENFSFYENNASNLPSKTWQNEGEENAWIASYSAEGKYQWSQKIGGQATVQMSDITKTENGLAVIVNFKGTLDLKEGHSISSQYTENLDGAILQYDFNGNLKWYHHLYSEASNIYNDHRFIRLTAITATKENNLVVAMACTDIVKGKIEGKEEWENIYSTTTNGIIGNISLFSEQGEFVKNIYSLSGMVTGSSSNDATMIFQDMVLTSQQDILLGGYYYSTKDIDVDKNGSNTGEYDFTASTVNTPNGFMLKLDLEGTVKFSDCMYRKERAVYAASTINTVNEAKDGKIIAGGNFSWETITTKNFYQKYLTKENKEPYYTSKIGTVEGWLLMENANQEETGILEKQNIVVNNYKKKYTITTEVKSHTQIDQEGNETEVKGGKITGIYNQTIDGITYTEEGIHYVETVKYGESSNEEIIITPEEGYQVETILINGQPYTDFTVDEQGKVTIPTFSNIVSKQHISVTFCKKIMFFYELPLTGSPIEWLVKTLGEIFILVGLITIQKVRRKTN